VKTSRTLLSMVLKRSKKINSTLSHEQNTNKKNRECKVAVEDKNAK
jgi:hypothetical protein